MKFYHILHAIYNEPWLIKPSAHKTIHDLVSSRLAGLELEELSLPEPPSMKIENGIATIPIDGVIGRKLGLIEKACGAVGVEEISSWINEAQKNPEVKAIIFDIDSPGGTVGGVPELAEEIKAVSKPKIAFSSGLMASAAYWLASSTDRIYATQSAEIGSIGVYLPFYDETKAYENEGVQVELIKAGKLKGTGFPGTSLSESQREYLQRGVDQIHSLFKASILEKREVCDEVMQGQTFFADEAQNHRLIDGQVKSIETVKQLLAETLNLA
jgi:signal peptide peptidase SppA